jgi:hypothetical protein
MSTDIQSRALLLLSLGLVAAAGSLQGQSAAPAAAEEVTEGTIELSYRLQELKRNQSGQYEMTGTLRGERSGKASVEFGFDEGSSGEANRARVHASWVVRAVPESESFKAKLKGTADLVSGQTHLVGTITDGAGKGQRVETKSRLLNFGQHGSLSDIDGNMVIGGAKSEMGTSDTTLKKEH